MPKVPVDVGQKLTDEVIEKLEKKIDAVYREASDDVLAAAKEYFDKFNEKRDKEMLEHVANGDVTEQQYKEWRIAQIGRGRRLEALSKRLAERLTEADSLAIDYLNETTPTIYAINRNYTAYTIERSGNSIDYTLWNESAVRRLMTMKPSLTAVMPHYPVTRAIDRGINLAYGQKMIKKTVLSGILRGLSVPDMAKNLATSVTTMSKASAIRAVRTASTGAQNGGRQDTLQDAAAQGIKVEKRWIAAHDFRTRAEHGHRDGLHIPVDQEWVEGLMFPGDPNGPPYEVYNCRCSQRAWFPEVADSYKSRETYEEWYKRKLEELGDEKVKEEFMKNNNSSPFYKKKTEASSLSVTNTSKIVDKLPKYGTIGVGGNNIIENQNRDGSVDLIHTYTTLGGAPGIYVNRADNLYQYAQKIKPIDGYTDITCHADEDFFYIELVAGTDKEVETVRFSAEDFSILLLNSKSYNGGAIRVMGCNAGAKDDGIAQRLANELNVDVLAATETVNVDDLGNVFISDDDDSVREWVEASLTEKEKIKETGGWKVFHPRR